MRFKPSRLAGALVVAGMLSACATQPDDQASQDAYQEANDPAQSINEAIFEFNLILDKAVLRPLARVYEFVLPDLARDGVRNFLRNLRTPVILANDLMQGEVDRAGETMGRFMLNTAVGAGGIFDVAGEAGVTYHEEDFGQTLAVWGSGEGPYVMLPLLGPSNVRDTGGIIVDTLIDPFFWWGINEDDEWIIENNGLVRGVATAIDTRSRNYRQLEDLEATSLDFYATVRSLYRQTRNNLIRNGVEEENVPVPGIGFDTLDPMEDPAEISYDEELGPQASVQE